MPDQSSSTKGKSQTKAAIDNKKKLDLPLDFSFKDISDIAGKFQECHVGTFPSFLFEAPCQRILINIVAINAIPVKP